MQIYNTPEGVLSSEEGVYVAALVRDKNVRLARGRMKMYDEEEGEEEAAGVVDARAGPLRPSMNQKATLGGKKAPRRTGEGLLGESRREGWGVVGRGSEGREG